MKTVFFFFFFAFSLSLSAQNISGLYRGTLQNDSAKQTQQYELALSEYRGKITGYAYATFIANDTFYYSIRRVKATREGSQLVVVDAEMLANNFPQRPDKGVYRTSYIPLQNVKETDTLTTFSGNWKTNRTKTFYAVPGTMAMKRQSDSASSALVAHLKELNLIQTDAPVYANQTAPAEPVVTKKEKAEKAEKAKPAPVVARTEHEDLKKLDNAKPAPAAAASGVPTTIAYNDRKKPAPQIFDITSDSLTLSFYDNGVVDGDVISVYINGEAIIAQAKLLAAATKKTIHLPAGTDAVELLLVAETLGSIPPNTGLLVVQDGNTRYDVRFTADLQTNAAIVFRKKK